MVSCHSTVVSIGNFVTRRGRGGLLTSAVKAPLLRVLVPAALRVTQNARRICAALGLKGNPSYRSLQHWTVVSFQPKV